MGVSPTRIETDDTNAPVRPVVFSFDLLVGHKYGHAVPLCG